MCPRETLQQRFHNRVSTGQISLRRWRDHLRTHQVSQGAHSWSCISLFLLNECIHCFPGRQAFNTITEHHQVGFQGIIRPNLSSSIHLPFYDERDERFSTLCLSLDVRLCFLSRWVQDHGWYSSIWWITQGRWTRTRTRTRRHSTRPLSTVPNQVPPHKRYHHSESIFPGRRETTRNHGSSKVTRTSQEKIKKTKNSIDSRRRTTTHEHEQEQEQKQQQQEAEDRRTIQSTHSSTDDII